MDGYVVGWSITIETPYLSNLFAIIADHILIRAIRGIQARHIQTNYHLELQLPLKMDSAE